MRLFLALVALVITLTMSGLNLEPRPSSALTGSSIYLPLVSREAHLEPVTIVQRDGHQAVYWIELPSGQTANVNIYLEVENHANRNVTGVSVEFRAFDSTGTLLSDVVTNTKTLIDVLRPGQQSPVLFTIPFPGGNSAFQSAFKEFTVLPGWTYTDNDQQAGLEFSTSFPGAPASPPPGTAMPTPTRTATPTPTAAAQLVSRTPGTYISQTIIPHTLEGRSACTTCHFVGGVGVGAPGGTGMPPDHAGRTDSTCTGCHQQAVIVPPTATPTKGAPMPLQAYGWAKNTGSHLASGVTAVVTVRGNERASGLALDARKVSVGNIPPGYWFYFSTTFSRDYGEMYGAYEVVLQQSFEPPGILAAW